MEGEFCMASGNNIVSGQEVILTWESFGAQGGSRHFAAILRGAWRMCECTTKFPHARKPQPVSAPKTNTSAVQAVGSNVKCVCCVSIK